MISPVDICEPAKFDHMVFFHPNALTETTLQVQCTIAALKAKVPN